MVDWRKPIDRDDSRIVWRRVGPVPRDPVRLVTDADLPCPWCHAPTAEADTRCPSCERRFG